MSESLHHQHGPFQQYDSEHQIHMDKLRVGNLRTVQDSPPLHHLHHHTGMRMTFSSPWEYHVVVLFDDWEINSPVSYLLSCVLIIGVVVLTHYIKHLIFLVEIELKNSNSDPHTLPKGPNLVTVILHYLKAKMSLSTIHTIFSTTNYTVRSFVDLL